MYKKGLNDMKKAPELTVVAVEAPVIEITTKRYEQLIAAEKELQLLKNALNSKPGYTDITEIKRIFNIESEVKNNA